MRKLRGVPPQQPDDFTVFRAVVRKAPPLFLAILIVLGAGAILSRLVFFTYSSPDTFGAFISIKGAMEEGGDAQGQEEDEGARGEEEEQAEEEPLPADESEADYEAPLEPSRWLKPAEEKPTTIGPVPTSAPRPEKGGAPGVKPAITRGGQGKGEKGSGSGSGSPWGNRSGSGRGGSARFGSNKASESAVELGLNWLRRHQSENGVWRAESFTRYCKHGQPCTGLATGGMNHDSGVTALALMAYLGAGYTHQEGRFRSTVRRALDYLVAIQDPDGRFGSEDMYTQSLAVIALAEAFGMTRDETFRESLRRGTDFLVRVQQPRGGWTYAPDPRNPRNDTSITVFALMALKSARAAGAFVPESCFHGVRRHFSWATRPDGTVWYADRDPGWRRGGAGMIAAGLFASFLLGRPPDHPVVPKQIARLVSSAPVWGDDQDLDQCYMTWYYQNLAFFVLGGTYWARWNAGFRDLLVERQRHEGCMEGSWDPADCWGRHAGRVYSTAIHVLNLEIYYRYTPSFLLPSETAWTDPVETSPRDRPDAPGEGQAGPPGRKETDEDPAERMRRLRELIGK